MRLHFDIADMLVRFSLDDSDFAVVLTGILTAVSYIQKLAVGIVSDPVGTEFQLDRIQQLESVTAEYADHPVVATGHEHFIEGRNARDTLRFLKTGNTFQPFASLQIATSSEPFSRPATKSRLPLTSTSMWSMRPLTFGMEIVCTKCKGAALWAFPSAGKAQSRPTTKQCVFIS